MNKSCALRRIANFYKNHYTYLRSTIRHSAWRLEWIGWNRAWELGKGLGRKRKGEEETDVSGEGRTLVRTKVSK